MARFGDHPVDAIRASRTGSPLPQSHFCVSAGKWARISWCIALFSYTHAVLAQPHPSSVATRA